MIYKPLTTSIEESRNAEDTRAMVSKTDALVTYLAIMTGVEIPSEEESETILNE